MDQLIILSMIISLFGLLVGLFYNSRKYHAPFESFLKINSVRFRTFGKGEIEIQNYGPGLALNIVVKNKNITIIGSTKEKKSFNKIWKNIKSIKGVGTNELKKDEISYYSLKRGPSFKYPIVIKWKTIKGEKQKTYWKIRNGHDIKIIQTNFFINTLYEILIFFKNLFFFFRKGK